MSFLKAFVVGAILGATLLLRSAAACDCQAPPAPGLPWVEFYPACLDGDGDGVCIDDDIDDSNPFIGAWPIYKEGDPCWVKFFGIAIFVCWF